MNSTALHAAIAVAALILMGSPGARAGTTGKIAGKVTDSQSKEALIGVNVIVVGTTLGASTNIDGEYFILNVPPGTFELRASGVGYTAVAVNNVNVTADQTTRIAFTLGAQSVQLGDVVVTATRPIVQRDLTSTVSSVSSDQISKLPLEDVGAVVNLQAGVVEGHFRGGRSGEVRYLVDGVAVNDVFSGNSTLEADISSIQEIQVLSGTFNAEYGEAMSGIVNQITKIAGDAYTGEFSAYTGDYITGRTGLFWHINHISPSDLYNFQGNLSGPVPGTEGLLKFFLSGRYVHDDGYLYGQRVFNPQDSSNFSAQDPSQWYVGATGDKKFVPMNFHYRVNLQGKLNLMVGNSKGVSIGVLYQGENYRDYDQLYRLNPDGDYLKFQKSFLGSAAYTHVFNDATFLDLSGSMFLSDFKQYVYADPLDPRYANPDRLRDAGANSFLTGGTENWHFYHKTNTYTGKADLTAQITQVHQIKAGTELQFHTLNYTDYQIHVDATTGFKPALPVPGSFDYNVYKNRPYQLAGYVQDKIELEYLVVNVGLRFDYFQPDANVLRDPNNIAVLDPLQPPFPDSLLTKASAKWQFSPRIGISFPISDRGAVHFSYGHFFQIPPFDFLYRNPNFRIPLTGTFPEFVGNTIGNANLQPQRTTMYEIGLQQELTPELGLTVTGYAKDIRNLLGIQVNIKNDFRKYGMYVNRDYGAVRGFTISFDKRMSGGFAANVDYTFQIAKGDASDPDQAFLNAQASPPIETNKSLVPLSWDRRHSLNVTVTAGTSDDFIVSAIGRLGSGLPYTPSLINERTGLENSDSKPTFYNVDLYITKYLKVYSVNVSVFAKVYNLFDTANEIDVYGDTGRAGYTLALTQAQSAPRGVNTLAEFLSRPDFYSAPRQIVIGAAVSF